MRDRFSYSEVIISAPYAPPKSWEPVEEFLALCRTMTAEQKDSYRDKLRELAAEIRRETTHLPQPAPVIVQEFLVEFGEIAS